MMKNSIAKDIEEYFDRLWPLNRSLTGVDFQTSLDILGEIMPMDKIDFFTNQRVLDWTIPNEWNVNEAYILKPNGEKIADFKVNNLHLLGYSIPFKGELDLEELKNYLYTLPNQKSAIPYVTSYYKERWGFCLAYNEYEKLEPGRYKVHIDTELAPGKLTVGESVIKGRTDEEILLSSYLCHPSMANNELSGPLVLSFIYQELVKKQRELRYTYRFVILPETIGAVAYLSKRGETLKNHVVAGYQITCIGDRGRFTYKKSRRGNSLADRAAIRFMQEQGSNNIIDFNPAIGSDERQWCSPGFNLPIGSLMRTMYTEYPEYHTSLDNKTIMSFGGMERAVQAYLEILRNIECNFTYRSTSPYGEPQLGPRGLFRSISDKTRDVDEMAMWWLLNYADGEHDLLQIAELSGYDMRIKSDLDFLNQINYEQLP